LLAVQLVSAVGGVRDPDRDGVLSLFEQFGNVEGEGKVSSGVGSGLFTVDPDGRLIIDGLEVQEVAAVGLLSNLQGAPVPQRVLRGEAFLNTRERRLDGEGDASERTSRPFR
jgi:hypothetical protein